MKPKDSYIWGSYMQYSDGYIESALWFCEKLYEIYLEK